MVLPAFMFAGINAQIMTIDECRTQAIENNKQLMNARLEMDASKETKKEAFTNYFPTVSATGMAINANTEMVKMDAEVPIVGELPMSFMKNGKAASVTAIQPIFAGGRIVNGNKLAEIGNEASGLQMEITEDEVIINTESYFWQIVSMKEKLITIGLLDKQLENIYNDVKISVEAGVAMRNDLLRVELQRQELESTKLKLENGINIVSLLLAQYIGHPDSVFEISYTEIGRAHV